MFENLPVKFRPSVKLPRETRATCDKCVMAKTDWPKDARDPGPFDAKLKCCTYFPFLPNFTVAKLMGDPAQESRLKLAIGKGHLTPLGLLPPNEMSSSNDFGRLEGERCPFMSESAACTIWDDRPTVCRSYFCVSDERAEGQAKWRAAEAQGNALEWEVAHEILWEMGLTQDEIDTRSFAEWKGREREFFARCLEISNRL